MVERRRIQVGEDDSRACTIAADTRIEVMAEQNENVFRAMCVAVLLLTGIVRDYYWWLRGYLRSGVRQSPSEVVSEILRGYRESLSASAPLAFFGILYFGGLAAYI